MYLQPVFHQRMMDVLTTSISSTDDGCTYNQYFINGTWMYLQPVLQALVCEACFEPWLGLQFSASRSLADLFMLETVCGAVR